VCGTTGEILLTAPSGTFLLLFCVGGAQKEEADFADGKTILHT